MTPSKGEHVEQPIVLRFHWTPGEVQAATRVYRAHSKSDWEEIDRVIITTLLTVACAVSYLQDELQYWVLATLAYMWIVKPIWYRRSVRRFCASLSNGGCEYRLQANALMRSTETSRSEYEWRAITKAVNTPAGIALFLESRTYLWLPSSAFASEEDAKRAEALIKENVKKYILIA